VIATIPAALPRARELLAPALRDVLARLSPDVRQVAAYHMGLVDAEGRPSGDGAGKAVRPALTLLGAEAAGARPERALPGALAVELVHEFSLLHDDVMDRDRERRHRPSAWSLFGIGPAIVAGDALLALSQDVLLQADGEAGVAAATVLLSATERMIEGQGQDLGFESRLDVSVEECLAMVRNKTGALLGCAGAIGGTLAGAPGAVVRALEAFGEHLGIAFQAIDDVLGIWGRPEETGKPVASDLRQRKKTLPVAWTLERGGPCAARLAAAIQGPLSEEDVRAAEVALHEAGARAWTLGLADRHAAIAAEALAVAGIAEAPRVALGELAAFVLSREF
jgi:geranylgeranyl diphosphate synthase, type I